MSNRMDAGFARVDSDLRELRVEVAAHRGETHSEFAAHRNETRGEFAAVRSEIGALRATMVIVGGSVTTALVGAIATFLAQG